MNQRCYVSHSPVSCSATDGKRDRDGERGRALSVRHVSHAAWRLCMTPKTTLLKRGSAHFHWPGDRTDLFLTTLTCAEGQYSLRFSLCWGLASSSCLRSRGSREVQPGTQCHSSLCQQDSDQSLVIYLLPGLLLPLPPPLTLSHTHHPASLLKWKTSPRQQKGWWHRSWGQWEKGKNAKRWGRTETVVWQKTEWKKQINQLMLCLLLTQMDLHLDMFLSVCMHMRFWESLFRLSSVSVWPKRKEEALSTAPVSLVTRTK